MSSYVVTLRLMPGRFDRKFLEKKFRAVNRIYNTAVKDCINRVEKLKNDPRYDEYNRGFRTAKKAGADDEIKEYLDKIGGLVSEYELNEFDIQKRMAYQKNRSMKKCLVINIVQKEGTKLSKAVRKAIFSGKRIHFREIDDCKSFEDKSAKTGIIYHGSYVEVMGRKIKIRTIRKSDNYLMECLSNGIVRYCRIVRKPFRTGYRYFLQIVMKGELPDKVKPGKGTLGLDQGISTVAMFGSTVAAFGSNKDGTYPLTAETNFKELFPKHKRYEDEIKRYSRSLERKLRINNPDSYNPDSYNPDGTPIKGAKLTYTKNVLKEKWRLKNAYRLLAEANKQSHGYDTNRIIEKYTFVIKEGLNFSSFQRKKKKTERNNVPIEITKNGETKTIYKYKRKKRFGKSIQSRSPGKFNDLLEYKLLRYHGNFYDVNTKEYKASQYDHVTDSYNKPLLSDRTKTVGGHLVQRDLYSAFLLYCMRDAETVDRELCEKMFKPFLGAQENTVNEILHIGDTTKNFGLKDFIK